MQATYGSNANNGIKTEVRVVAGTCTIRTTLPATVVTSQGAGTVVDGLVSSLVANPTLASWWRMKLKVWNPSAPDQARIFTLETLVSETVFPLRASDTALSISYTVELDSFWGGNHSIAFMHATITGITLLDTDLVLDPMDVQGVVTRSLKVPAGATKVRFMAYGAEGDTAKLLNGIALELPASDWYAGVVDVCGTVDAAGEPVSRARCKYVKRREGAPWSCQLYTVHCDGHKTGCGAYRPNPGCNAWFVTSSTFFPTRDGMMEVTDDTVANLFDQFDGLGLIPWANWRGTREEWLEHYGAVLTGITYPTRYHCHKFDSAGQNTLPCYAANETGMAQLTRQNRSFWRYVKSDLTLNTAMTKDGHNELVLKGTDIPLHDPADYGSTAALEAVAVSSLEARADGSMQPRCYLPESFPEGEYDVWAYAKHTIGFPLALVAESTLDSTGIAIPTSRWQVPAAANYGWVKLTPSVKTPAPVLSPFMRLRFAIDPAGLGQTLDYTTFSRNGEFAFKSLYLERVR